MQRRTVYNCIERSGQAQFSDRGSKFIGYAFPIDKPELFKQTLAEIKKEHPKASHFCFAYRIGNDETIFRSGDDGEPSGTAGKPILGQIDSKALTNTGVVVVRYFGGSLLGVPGLINAYKTTASLVLQTVPVVQKQVESIYRIQFDYTMMNPVMMILRSCNCTIIQQEAQLFCMIKTGIPLNRLEEVLYRFRDLQQVELSQS